MKRTSHEKHWTKRDLPVRGHQQPSFSFLSSTLPGSWAVSYHLDHRQISRHHSCHHCTRTHTHTLTLALVRATTNHDNNSAFVTRSFVETQVARLDSMSTTLVTRRKPVGARGGKAPCRSYDAPSGQITHPPYNIPPAKPLDKPRLP